MFGFPYSIVEGDYWRVSEDLAVTRDIVTPKAFFRGPAGIDGNRFVERNGIVILGIYYEILGNNVGFDLEAFDDTGTYKIITPRTPASATGRVCESITPCCIPLNPGASSSPTASGATLRVTLSGSPTGRIMIWGVHGTIAASFPPKAFTGSPTTF